MVSSGEQGEVVVAVNVGGVRQLLPSDLLCRFPETRLGRLCLLRCSPGAPVLGAAPELALDLCDDFDPRSGEFYFDRDPRSFDSVLDLYYVGEIHMERGVCPICFKNEMDFWQVDVDHLDDCCRGLFSEKLEELEEVARRVRLVLDDQAGAGEGDCWKRFRKTLWKLMEKPETSAQARMLAIASFLVVLVSAVTMCLGTIPELQVKSETGQLVEHPTVTIIETVCIVWFTLEYVLRLISAPQTLHFVFSFMNIIDVLAILPYYMAMLLSGMGDAILELNNVQQAVQALRIMRIARVFKLARHSSGLQTLTSALKSSFKELSLLLLCLAMGIFLFSALGKFKRRLIST
uniref:potassium voltage-gated channel subfamily F member 1-like n=1 Tax=Myxine glutinosa TaxID=7769 RepID=UPI00358E5CFE